MAASAVRLAVTLRATPEGRLTVADTGRSCPEHLSRIFEPTTKDVWTNIGLGLAVPRRRNTGAAGGLEPVGARFA